VSTFSIIDYVGGLEDLQHRVIRSIGDPEVRFREDPVRMLRAVVLAARLGFTVDPAVQDAIARHGRDIRLSAPARLMEEYHKILRSGAATRVFQALAASGLLRHMTPEISSPLPDPLERALGALDRYRAQFEVAPESLTNAILLGTLLVPLGLLTRPPRRRRDEDDAPRSPLPALGDLPVARRDVERLGQILSVQRRLLDTEASPRAKASLAHRHVFRDALTWLEIHGDAPDVVAHWREWEEPRAAHRRAPDEAEGEVPARRRRRRRRRRRVVPGE
jgi:poly(A) polymerase